MVRFPSFVTSSILTTPGWNSRLPGFQPAKRIPLYGNLDSNDLSWRAMKVVDPDPIRDHSPSARNRLGGAGKPLRLRSFIDSDHKRSRQRSHDQSRLCLPPFREAVVVPTGMQAEWNCLTLGRNLSSVEASLKWKGKQATPLIRPEKDLRTGLPAPQEHDGYCFGCPAAPIDAGSPYRCSI
jgi:hypothetical protein